MWWKKIVKREKGNKINDYLPLYQRIEPKSCGPWVNLQLIIIWLPDFTYKSFGPSICAFNSIFLFDPSPVANDDFFFRRKCNKNEKKKCEKLAFPYKFVYTYIKVNWW